MDGEIDEPTTPVVTDIPITTPSLTKEEIIEIVKEEVKKEFEKVKRTSMGRTRGH